MHRSASKMIAKADKDGDGKISFDEAALGSNEADKAVFEEIDFKKDGKLDEDEVSKYLTD